MLRCTSLEFATLGHAVNLRPLRGEPDIAAVSGCHAPEVRPCLQRGDLPSLAHRSLPKAETRESPSARLEEKLLEQPAQLERRALAAVGHDGRHVGLTPELIADSEERLSVQSQIKFLDEAAIALKDDCLGFTLAREHDPRQIGLLYYVMASSQTLGDALKRVARYSQITNEALVVRYQEGNRLTINLSYSGVPRHSDRHQIEF